MTDKLDRVAAAGVAVAALILFLAIGRYAYGESRVRCAESPGKGQWHSRQVDGRRCWFKGYHGKFSASELYWPGAFDHHADRVPTNGYEATRQAAMAAFAKSWRRE